MAKESNNKPSVTKDAEFKILLTIKEIGKMDEKISNVTNDSKKSLDKSETFEANGEDGN